MCFIVDELCNTSKFAQYRKRSIKRRLPKKRRSLIYKRRTFTEINLISAAAPIQGF